MTTEKRKRLGYILKEYRVVNSTFAVDESRCIAYFIDIIEKSNPTSRYLKFGIFQTFTIMIHLYIFSRKFL